jgi:two-component system sensor histidine kinase SenX3
VAKMLKKVVGRTRTGVAVHVAANHNGTVSRWSRPGIGSTFTLSLPACLDAEDR